MVSKWKKLEVMFEFLLFGIIIGITEDIIAVKLTTGASITPKMILIIVAIAVPFAIIGEMIADRVNLAKPLKRISDGMNHNHKRNHQRRR
ncbi:MAG: hypothetical protein KJI70_01455 [Patescibacteria group bacterium]|nr:hypothetical protein [Patescibacteria group bacterium]